MAGTSIYLPKRVRASGRCIIPRFPRSLLGIWPSLLSLNFTINHVMDTFIILADTLLRRSGDVYTQVAKWH